MNAQQKRLAEAIRRQSQSPIKTPQQKQFERFLKCPKERETAAKLIDALSAAQHRHGNAEPLTPPTQVLPPMF